MPITCVELDYARLCEKVQAIVDAGASGHIHTTPPGCTITGSSRRAIVLEATDDGAVFAFFDDVPIEERAKPLAVQLHGADSVPDDGDQLEAASLAVSEMAERMRLGKGHFHILNPVCLVNPNPGRWTILFEDDERGPAHSVSHQRPLADIRLIERLIYARASA